MQCYSLVRILAVLCTALSANIAFAVSYQATLLTADGFPNAFAYGVSGSTQTGVGYNSYNPFHAFLWNGTAASAVDLHPAGFSSSTAEDISGTQQVGHADSRAFLWSGTAASAVNLHPLGYTSSYAFGISGSTEVGYGSESVTKKKHALLWTGTAASVVDLHPANFVSSEASAVSGDYQVGRAYNNDIGGDDHAMLWQGTAASAIDLHPAGFGNSRAEAVSDGSQVGSGFLPGASTHALLWHGSAASVVDLNPPGFNFSQAHGVSGDMQVGNAAGPTAPLHGHAMLWRGTAASAVDFHIFLTGLGPTFAQSVANDITDNGSIVGYAADTGGRTYAVLWTPVPEPTSVALVTYAFCFAPLLCGRRRQLTQISITAG